MTSPLSATTQKYRQAFNMESVTLIKQGTKPRVNMGQCKTTDMIEILKLETDIWVLPLCQLFTAGRPDGKGHSQRALFTLLPIYRLSLILLIITLIAIIHYWSTLLLGKALWESAPVQMFLNHSLLTALIRRVIRGKGGGTPALNLTDLRADNGEEAGRGVLI